MDSIYSIDFRIGSENSVFYVRYVSDWYFFRFIKDSQGTRIAAQLYNIYKRNRYFDVNK